MNHFEQSEIEPDVRGVSGSLDRVAAAERASAPGSLEDRVYMASRAGLRAAMSTDAERPAHAEAPVFRIGWLLSGLRLAACLAVVGAGAATWMAVANRPAAATPDTSLAAWLEAYPSAEDGWTDLGSQIDALHADLLSVAATLEEDGEDDQGLGGVGEAM